MILIADSGSTKTDWRLWNPVDNKVISYSSKGLNPYFISSEDISSVIKSTIPANLLNEISQIYFYGSGCSSLDSKKSIEKAFKNVVSHVKPEVNHDLMGAARALFGKKAGIACILGTGSNACYYNGTEIEEEAVSFGFVMGDEGSGNHLGKLLLKGIFSKKAPQEIQMAFNEQFPELDLPTLLKRLYHESSANKFLASFSPFIHKYKTNEFVKEIIHTSFKLFVTEFIEVLGKSKQVEIGFLGSISFYYKEEIKEVFESKGMNPIVFIEKPINQLLKYHQEFN